MSRGAVSFARAARDRDPPATAYLSSGPGTDVSAFEENSAGDAADDDSYPEEPRSYRIAIAELKLEERAHG